MIQFDVFEKGKPAKAMSLNGSYLFGQEEIPVRAQLQFDNGSLIGIRHSDTAVGLLTMWEVDGFGKTLLQTTRLPERKLPYNLNLELARGRLLRISQKREEWALTDSIGPENDTLLDSAKEHFVQSLCHLHDPPKASLYADKVLQEAGLLGEKLSLYQAERGLEQRMAVGRGIGRHTFGCSVDLGRIHDKAYLEFLKDNFRFISLPVSWRQIEAKEQTRDFELLDEWIAWLSKHHIATQIGPLIHFSPLWLPDWLYIWENDFDQVREMAYDYISEMVARYSDKVHAWDVITGMNVDNCFKFSFEQIIEMTRSCVLSARHASPRSLLLVGVAEPWGDYYAYNQRTIPPLIYVDMICQGGVSFNALSIRVRFGRGGGGMQMRDLLEMSHLLDRMGLFGKTVHVSHVQVPSETDRRDSLNQRLGEAGYLYEPWTEPRQAEWLEKAYRILLSRSFVDTVTWQDLVDTNESALQKGGLLREDMTPKPAFESLRRLKKELVGSQEKRNV